MKANDIKKRCRHGDKWLLGDHVLLCGDSTKKESLDAVLGNEKADMVFTDPPYGVNFKSNFREATPQFAVIKNDDKILDFFPLVKEYNTGFFFCFCSVASLYTMLEKFTKHFNLDNMIIWNKMSTSMGDLKHTFATDYEIALVSNPNKRTLALKRCGSVWSISRGNTSDYLHPTQKPVALAEFAIKRCTNNRNIVLDMFGGSGTTLLACENVGRRCRMIELDEHYCDVIIARWEEQTGKKAEKV